MPQSFGDRDFLDCPGHSANEFVDQLGQFSLGRIIWRGNYNRIPLATTRVAGAGKADQAVLERAGSDFLAQCSLLGKWSFARAVLDKLDSNKVAAPAHVANLGKLSQCIAQRGLQFCSARSHPS